MPSQKPGYGVSASFDLGLGGMLQGQQEDQTDEELRKKRLGMAAADGNPFNFGMAGVAADLGMPLVGRR